jgi:hypothetical protein
MPSVPQVMQKFPKIFKNINLLSIGYNCYPSLIINQIKNEPYHLFDWTGSSLWGINKLIQDDFPVITNKQDLYIYENYRYFNGEKIYITTNQKYFIRFFHDFDKSLNELPDIKQDFIDKTLRRSIRTLNILKENKPLILIHLEDVCNRTNYTMQGHEQYYPKITDNKKYIEEYSRISLNDAMELTNTIINKYNTNILLAYFSIYLPTHHIKSKNIFVINLGLKLESYQNKDICKSKMIHLLNKYSETLIKIINNKEVIETKKK